MGKAPLCDSECGAILRSFCADRGIDAHVTTVPPLILNAYNIQSGYMVCPHGVKWFMEPTTDQIAQWARDGVE